MSEPSAIVHGSSHGHGPQERPWHEDWEVGSVPVLETARETIFAAQHLTTARLAWWHVLAVGEASATDWNSYFQQAAETHAGEDFAELLAWGDAGNRWVYVTAAANAEPLTKWKPRRQTSSASSIRLGLMLQAVQMALRLLRGPSPARSLDAKLMAVEHLGPSGHPYRLKAHGWLPVVDAELKPHAAQVMSDTEKVLNLLAAGIPWPIELTRALADQTANAQQRLQQGEAVLLAQQERSARPTMTEVVAAPVSGRRPGWWIRALLGTALLTMVFYYASRSWRGEPAPSVVSAVPTAAPGASAQPPAATAEPGPPLVIPAMDRAEIARQRQLLEEALAEKEPTGPRILPAALGLLKLVPDDPEARQWAQHYLHREVEIQISLAKYQSLTSYVRWQDFEELNFPEARLLSAVASWRTSPTTALEDLRQLADQAYPAANVMIGQLLSNPESGSPNFISAAEYFRKAAEQKYPPGQCLLGICYLENKGVPQDLNRGVALLKEAAAAGNPRALYRLGICYQDGTGVNQDFAEARKLLNAAAGSGCLDANAPLALMYLRGLGGVSKDVSQGLTMLQEAAEQGDAESNFNLGLIAEMGLSKLTTDVSAAEGKPDPVLARQYFTLAAATGHKKAQLRLQQNPP